MFLSARSLILQVTENLNYKEYLMSHVTKKSTRRTGSTRTSIQFAHLLKKKRGIVTVFVSCGCYLILPQIWCFETSRMYSLTILEIRSLKSASWGWNEGSRGSWKNLFLASSSFQWLLAFFGCGQSSASVFTLPFLICVSYLLCLSLIRTLVTECGSIQMIQDHLPIWGLLITSAKTLLP